MFHSMNSLLEHPLATAKSTSIKDAFIELYLEKH
ncbi:hypothetical protein SAMN04487777_104376 [Priestia aryabhattai B8W22]|nr:hypothetical protein SAMN04487777_104376 [Priestia aryabhattai B8W22]